RATFNSSGTPESVSLDGKAYVEHIAYDAKRQRVLIAYGNHILTRYAYDPQTFRLRHLRSEPFNNPADFVYGPAGVAIQDFAYEHDLAGNILGIHDRTRGCGIKDSVLGLDAIDRVYSYDAAYRLRSATGRECDLPPDRPWDPAPRCTDLTKAR